MSGPVARAIPSDFRPTASTRGGRAPSSGAVARLSRSCFGHPLPRVEPVLRRPFFEKFRELGIRARSDGHLERNDLVAGALLLNAFAAQAQLPAAIRALRDRHRYRTCHRWHGYPGPEHRLSEA